MSAAIIALTFLVQAGILLFLLCAAYRWHKESRTTPRKRRAALGIAQPPPQPELSLVTMSWWIAPASKTPSATQSMQQRMQHELNATRRHKIPV
jgi:hypothetical protein